MLSQNTINAINTLAAMTQDFINTLPVSVRPAVQASAQACLNQLLYDLETAKQEPKDADVTNRD